MTASDTTKGFTSDTTTTTDPKGTQPASDMATPVGPTTVDAPGLHIGDEDLDRLADRVAIRLAQRQLSHNQGGYDSTAGPSIVVSQSGEPWQQCSTCGTWAAPGVTHACANDTITPVAVAETPVAGETPGAVAESAIPAEPVTTV